ncbi:phospho-N-acetylmuramoyl-pentapeptide-transferase homolog isoform X3 [Salvia miltiorrhiza]|nr:phospho-N-acetylmuramoyl-pentapeptide-transferase homolog isoform X3 [Salvia miltiorrhiza]
MQLQSHAVCASNSRNLSHVGFLAGCCCLRLPPSRVSSESASGYVEHKLFESRVPSHGFRAPRRALRVCAMDDDFGASFGDWGNDDRPVEYMYSSSEGDDSDGDLFLQPITDVDLPTSKERLLPSDDSITVTAHRLATLGNTRRRRKTVYGIWNNVGLMSFSTFLLLLVDQCAWRIVRLPLAPFYLMRPFLISAILVSCVGYICVPLFRMLNLRSRVRKGAPAQHSLKKGTPSMGGLYFVPIGLLVAEVVLKFSSVEVSAAAAVTIAFAAIGLLDDFLSISNKSDGLSGWIRILLEAATGMWFSYWLWTTDISTPYNMKTVVPLPGPLGLVCLGKFYPVLSSFCFVSMANGVNLTDGLDGLAAGTAALAFIGMSIVVLPICSVVATCHPYQIFQYLEHRWLEHVLVFFSKTSTRHLYSWATQELWLWVGLLLQWLLALECSSRCSFHQGYTLWKHFQLSYRYPSSRRPNIFCKGDSEFFEWRPFITTSSYVELESQ